MIIDRFIATYGGTEPSWTGLTRWKDPRLEAEPGYVEIGEAAAGRSFGHGLYRFHDLRSGPRAKQWVDSAFPSFAKRSLPFACDWLGRQFAIDLSSENAGGRRLLLMEPGFGQVLEIPVNIIDFHNVELVDFADAAIAANFFGEWLSSGQDDVEFDQCVGYDVPLFLGGRDESSNLALTDMAVYWDICGQLLRGTLDLPTGTRISSVHMR